MQWPAILGLPPHPLIVHATVVLVPLAAVAVILHAFVPRARPRLGLVTPGLALAAMILVPLSTGSGEQLESQMKDTALIEQHARLAEGLLPWVVGLFVVAVLLVVRDWRAERRTSRFRPSWLYDGSVARAAAVATKPLVLGVLAVALVSGTTVQVALIGHSGAKAAWHGVPSASQH